MKENLLSLFSSSTNTEAYVGDGILIGDAGTNLPFSTIDWTVSQTQNPENNYHTISIFVVPERFARRHLHLFHTDFQTDGYFRVTREAETQAIGIRSYIYLLPQMYLKRKKDVAKVEYRASIRADLKGEDLGSAVYQFDNLADFSDFLDREPYAGNDAIGCRCNYGNAIGRSCPENDQKCIETLKALPTCLGTCFDSDTYFTTKVSSYNYFSLVVPRDFFVQYNISIDMYFYDHTKLEKFFKCSISRTDECPFTTTGYLRGTRLWNQREIIIAYVHPPMTTTGTVTTRLLVEAKVRVDYAALVAVLCGMLTLYLVLKYCLKLCTKCLG